MALYKSGVDPVIVGAVLRADRDRLPGARADLERATDLFRLFREQPTAELARSLRQGVRIGALSERAAPADLPPVYELRDRAAVRARERGIVINGDFLSRAFSSAITLGIIVGYVVGKPIGIVGGPWLVTRLSRGRMRPPVGWASVLGGGTIAGIGFTVSLLIASLAFHGSSSGGQARGAHRRGRGVPADVACVPRHLAAAPRRGCAR